LTSVIADRVRTVVRAVTVNTAIRVAAGWDTLDLSVKRVRVSSISSLYDVIPSSTYTFRSGCSAPYPIIVSILVLM
jgi:hypothetical protein